MRERLWVRLWVWMGMHARTTACMRLRVSVDACTYGCAQIIFACGHACMFVCRLVRFRVCPWVSMFSRLSMWSVNKCAHEYFLKKYCPSKFKFKVWMIWRMDEFCCVVGKNVFAHAWGYGWYIPWFTYCTLITIKVRVMNGYAMRYERDRVACKWKLLTQ